MDFFLPGTVQLSLGDDVLSPLAHLSLSEQVYSETLYFLELATELSRIMLLNYFNK